MSEHHTILSSPVMTPACLADLCSEMREVRSARVGVWHLHGYSHEIFSLGGDLRLVLTSGYSARYAYAQLCLETVWRALELTCRTVAHVYGKAYGGGLEAALACDTVVMAKGAVGRFPEFSQGHFPFAGAAEFCAHWGIGQPGPGWKLLGKRTMSRDGRPEISDQVEAWLDAIEEAPLPRLSAGAAAQQGVLRS